MKFKRRRAGACAALLLIAPAVAVAQDQPQMRLGPPAPAPPGFQRFCEREPSDCPSAARAGKGYWTAAFGAGKRYDAYAGPPSAIRTRSAPRGWFMRAVRAAPPEMAPPATRDGRIRLTTETSATLERVNRQVNGSIVSAADWKVYGQKDYWALPLSRAGRRAGDCEDYVLEKRHQLLAAGFPMAQLSVALVRTRRGDTHAVLLVETDQGPLVLDNRSDKVRPWARLKDRWIMRQSPDSPGQWMMIRS
jgi:predicted transglutaminase-like cysteine proteinase